MGIFQEETYVNWELRESQEKVLGRAKERMANVKACWWQTEKGKCGSAVL